MQVKSFTFNPFQENTYVLYDKSKECIIIDPGCYEKNEQLELQTFIQENQLKPVKLINTHCHIDHILGNQFVSNKWSLKLYMHEADLPILENAREISKAYGLQNYTGSPYPEDFLEDGDVLKFGNTSLDILFTPGHAPGHICLYNKEKKILIAGDVIFKGSIGRTDLPGGNFETLINSIQEKLFPLPNEMQIYCGHGPETTLAHEKESNPFLQ